ncbi:MAG: Hpt domain-containing protein [Bacteriovoracia bacterium]
MINKAPLIHPESVKSLRELGDPGKDFYAEVAHVYLQQAPAKVNEMENALAARDFAALNGLAHQLKSASANLGALGLTDLFIRVEEAAKLKDLENLLAVFPELKATFAAVKTELERTAGPVPQKKAA